MPQRVTPSRKNDELPLSAASRRLRKHVSSRLRRFKEAAFVPFREGPPEVNEDWYAPFLIYLSLHGTKRVASEAAGISYRTVYRHLESNPQFKDEYDAAMAYYLELLETELHDFHGRRGNVAGVFGRLKAELPDKYIERVQETKLAVSLEVQAKVEVTAEEADALLRSMVQSLPGHTRDELLSLPEAGLGSG